MARSSRPRALAHRRSARLARRGQPAPDSRHRRRLAPRRGPECTSRPASPQHRHPGKQTGGKSRAAMQARQYRSFYAPRVLPAARPMRLGIGYAGGAANNSVGTGGCCSGTVGGGRGTLGYHTASIWAPSPPQIFAYHHRFVTIMLYKPWKSRVSALIKNAAPNESTLCPLPPGGLLW